MLLRVRAGVISGVGGTVFYWRRLKHQSAIAAALDDDDQFVLPPLPNSLFMRDSSAWIYGGVSVNPMFWQARRRESLNILTIYRHHPKFQELGWRFWYPQVDRQDGIDLNTTMFGPASLEGGDVLPIGRRAVLIGMSERTTGRMIEELARELFCAGAADRVIVAVMTKDRAHMHLDTVLTMLDVDTVTAYPGVVNNVRAISIRPADDSGKFHVTVEEDLLSAISDALGVKKLRVVETGGDRYQAERRLPLSCPGAGRGGYLRAQHPHHRPDAEGGHRGDHNCGVRVGQRSRRWSLHDLSNRARPHLATGTARQALSN